MKVPESQIDFRHTHKKGVEAYLLGLAQTLMYPFVLVSRVKDCGISAIPEIIALFAGSQVMFGPRAVIAGQCCREGKCNRALQGSARVSQLMCTLGTGTNNSCLFALFMPLGRHPNLMVGI